MDVPFHPEHYFVWVLLAMGALTAFLIAATLFHRRSYELREARQEQRLKKIQELVEHLSRLESGAALAFLAKSARKLDFEDEAILVRVLSESTHPARQEQLAFLSSAAGERSLAWIARKSRNKWRRAATLQLMSTLGVPGAVETLTEAL